MNLKFRKKPVVIEAFQMTEERRASNADWPEWMHQAWQLDREAPGSLHPTEEGTGDGRNAFDWHARRAAPRIVGRLDHPGSERRTVPVQTGHFRGDV